MLGIVLTLIASFYLIFSARTATDAYVQAFASLDEVSSITLFNKISQQEEPILPHVIKYRTIAASDTGVKTNDGELAAFCAYACSFPNNCLCLIDTYDTLSSGLHNFIFVAKTLDDFGYTPKGVRLDSGDLAELSYQCRLAFDRVIDEDPERRQSAFGQLTIIASNDIDEGILIDLANHPRNRITSFGIGTNLVTCQAQPALGCVYKLVEWTGKARIKLSQDLPKVTIPGRKRVYRLYGQDGSPVVDYMALASEAPPESVVMNSNDGGSSAGGGGGIVCCNPFNAQDRVLVEPSKVQQLHRLVFEKGHCGQDIPSGDLSVTRGHVMEQLRNVFDESHTRYENPQSYGVMVSEELFRFLHELWEKETS
jgi:nicotinate phosphoribosyltransferase